MAGRRRRRGTRLPVASSTIIAISASLAGFILLYVALSLGGKGAEDVFRIFGALGTFCIFLNAGCFINAVHMLSAHQYELVTRILAVALTFAGIMVWMSVYFYGLIDVIRGLSFS